MPPTNATQTAGWTSQPNGRGTFDILQSCLLTIFLCCWTSICPNIPPKRASKLRKLLHKTNLACLAILGPEFVLVVALGQYAAACRSRKKFNDAGYKDWSMKHAFFADMGGFMLRSPGWPDLPLNGAQLFYLIENGYVPYPAVSKEDIDDKNKLDGLARVITILQGTWFLANSITRPIQKLALTTLELTTLSFILVMLATSFFWRHKPQDIQRAIILTADVHIFKIIADADAFPSKVSLSYRFTPLEFIDRQEWTLTKFWFYYTEILRRLVNIVIPNPPTSRPYDHIPNANFMNPDDIRLEFIGGLIVMAYSATFITGWNLFFPTRVEEIFWRVASLYNIGFGACGGSLVWYSMRLRGFTHSGQDVGRVKSRADEKKGPVGRLRASFRSFSSTLRNISPVEDDQLDIPLRFLIPITFLCVFYSIFRAYILVEDIIGLRELPVSAYQSVNWSLYLPNI